ncbi:MAG: LPS export ABC transporter periplasmic protein LptC [Gammaproteobacteria bacterium RIFCSPHIGHO2_12_FULL_37_14]|nr:MAG: LPS export ABC transporter periplasmic protein LptC [Gammaproteobacteria bacterium RIFCSPHIGHO2_12_FULL_37_14]
MTYKNTIISSITILMVLLAAWITLAYQAKPSISKQETPQPDTVMENVVATMMNKQGKPKLKIVTTKLMHYIENDTTDLISPELTLFRQSPQPWHITSKFAKASGGINQIDFWGNVVIRHAITATDPSTVIRTATLTVYPNKQTAETNDPITLAQPNTFIKATGMLADMNSGDIKLLSQARGEYVPSF